MTTPNQVYTHHLNPVKGWFHGQALDKAADLANPDATDPVRDGMVGSLNANGQLQRGLACDAMPIFFFQDETDFDVVGDTGGMVGSGGGNPVGGEPIPKMSGLVAIGGYELESTEYDVAESASLVPNAFITAQAPDHAEAGTIIPGTKYVDTICGQVSDGVKQSGNDDVSVTVVRFWPMFIPPVTTCPDSSAA